MGSEDLVTVLEVVYEGERMTHLGNAYSVSKAEAVEGIKAGKYVADLHGMGVIPEGWEGGDAVKAQNGKRKSAEAVE